MAVEFRKRTVSEYLRLLNHCKWQILLPTVAVFIAVAWVVNRMPNVYESTTFLTISPPAISEKVAPSLTDFDLSQRIQAINQTVLSRTSLEPMIEKYDLYREDKAAGMPVELIVGKMKDRINIEENVATNDKIVGFRVSYRAGSPEIAKSVTEELAGKYVAAQTAESKQSAEMTREFIDSQLEQAKQKLDSLEAERMNIMKRNVDTLPESAQGLIAQLDGLRQREQTIAKEKESQMTEKGRVEDSIRALNSQMRLIDDFGEKETQAAVTQASRVEDTPAYGQLVQKRAEFSSKLENLRKQYRDKHPEIIQAQTDINKINDEIDRLVKSNEQRIKQVGLAGDRKADMQKKSLEIEREKAQGQVELIVGQIRSKDIELLANAREINILEAKLNSIPDVKVQLEGVSNEYQSAKVNYDDLLKKFNNAQQQVQVESAAQGESIKVIDPANLPETPENAKKKPIFMAAGAGFGFFLGALFAAFFEVPKLFRIQNIDDLKHYTNLEVLAAIPSLLSEEEIKHRGRMDVVRVVLGVLAAAVSVPLLIFILEKVKVFERLG